MTESRYPKERWISGSLSVLHAVTFKEKNSPPALAAASRPREGPKPSKMNEQGLVQRKPLPARRRATASRPKSAKREAGPPSKREQATESQEITDPFPDLTQTLTYCRVLGVAALVSYVFAVAGIIILQSTGFASELSLIGLSLLGIPAIAIAVIVFVTLRALAESIKIFADTAGPLLRNQPPQE